jgi:hypothetical protein
MSVSNGYGALAGLTVNYFAMPSNTSRHWIIEAGDIGIEESFIPPAAAKYRSVFGIKWDKKLFIVRFSPSAFLSHSTFAFPHESLAIHCDFSALRFVLTPAPASLANKLI